MHKVLIIGAGGAAAWRRAPWRRKFAEICLASRTLAKCERIRDRLPRPIDIARVDADNPAEVAALIQTHRPRLVMNLALPYQDLSIMEACLATGVDYLDTANYEPPDEARFCYQWQWNYHERFRERGIMALLGCGFDPGATNVFCAYALKHHFDEIHSVDIMDCNAGEHGRPFATNFNPEINIREITQRGKFWENGQWREIEPLSVHRTFDFPGIGPREMYLLYHEELESLVRHLPGLQRIRFWMTFSKQYLTHLRVLQNVGLTRIDPVMYEGRPVVPLKFLKAVLPEPTALAEHYRGQTNIGCLMEGVRDGKPKRVYIYNICDHAACYREVQAQAISYTTGVPAMIGGMLMLTGVWRGQGVFNVEQFDPDPFMEQMTRRGLPWVAEVLDPPAEKAGRI